ncbi:MAG: NAD-dependent epimerase/dehydratase family protein [Burkholderiales bacterium]|nr:NAD-dependent epimerase/dehydratase family protein [Burkholderiales bacterium]
MKVLVTGCAGFLGMHCAERLLSRGDEVVGIDNLSPYYSVALKRARLARLEARRGFRFRLLDIAAPGALKDLFCAERPEAVLHLAAQPGVRHSLVDPEPYFQTNLVGFGRLLEALRAHPVRHLVFASSSSVYGANTELPWSEAGDADRPVSLYAATKRANELMAHAYSHLFGVPMTGVRYFTVYGPWGRPDMSPMLFARAIVEERPIRVFNRGDMARDFTYVDDAVEATVRLLDRPPQEAPAHRVVNVGNHRPVALADYIAALERALGKKALLELHPMQPGDVKETYADIARLRAVAGFAPATPLEEGLAKFAAWFREYGHLA